MPSAAQPLELLPPLGEHVGLRALLALGRRLLFRLGHRGRA